MTILVLVSCVLFVLLDFLSVFLPLLRFLFFFYFLASGSAGQGTAAMDAGCCWVSLASVPLFLCYRLPMLPSSPSCLPLFLFYSLASVPLFLCYRLPMLPSSPSCLPLFLFYSLASVPLFLCYRLPMLPSSPSCLPLFLFYSPCTHSFSLPFLCFSSSFPLFSSIAPSLFSFFTAPHFLSCPAHSASPFFFLPFSSPPFSVFSFSFSLSVLSFSLLRCSLWFGPSSAFIAKGCRRFR